MKIEVLSKSHPQHSAIEGTGMFATEAIPKGDTVCIFAGEEITIPELQERYAQGTERIDDPFQIASDKYLDLYQPYIFFNHSCDPNAGLRGRGKLFSLRDIEPGEEITFDYSTSEWTDDEAWRTPWNELWRVPCTCGSSLCRGEIRTFPSLSAERKEYYRKNDALPDFILERL